MLVLTRYSGQSIKLYLPGGDEIDVMLLSISEDGKSGRIGFKAPQEIRIYRQEIIEKNTIPVSCECNEAA